MNWLALALWGLGMLLAHTVHSETTPFKKHWQAVLLWPFFVAFSICVGFVAAFSESTARKIDEAFEAKQKKRREGKE